MQGTKAHPNAFNLLNSVLKSLNDRAKKTERQVRQGPLSPKEAEAVVSSNLFRNELKDLFERFEALSAPLKVNDTTVTAKADTSS